MSNIDYGKLRKLAEQHPEIADKVAEITKDAAGKDVLKSLAGMYKALGVVVNNILVASEAVVQDRDDAYKYTQSLYDNIERLEKAVTALRQDYGHFTLNAEMGDWQSAFAQMSRVKAPRLASDEGSAPYPNKIDHGYNQPLSGGWDIMKRLQDQLLIEQGRPPREPNPRLANCGGSCGGACSCGKKLPAAELQRNLVRVLQGGTAREMVRQAVVKYADECDTVVMVNAAVDEILDQALAVALSPDHMASVLDKHTIEEN